MRASPPAHVIACTLVALLLPACFSPGGDRDGGLPEVSIEFPESVAPGSVHTVRLEIANPGPSAFGSLLVTFSAVGAPSSDGIPTPIVGQGPRAASPVLAIDPEPVAVSSDGVVYRFRGLEEGAGRIIEFRVEVPDEPGPAGNAVIVSDGQDLKRATGVRLLTRVRG